MGSWDGDGARLPAAPRLRPLPARVPFFPERAVLALRPPLPPRPLPDLAALPPPEREPVPDREPEPRPPPEPPRPLVPLPREPPEPPRPEEAAREPPGGGLGSMTSSDSSLENSSKAAPCCPPRERAEPLGARVAMMTNVTRTLPSREAPAAPGVSGFVKGRSDTGSGVSMRSRTARTAQVRPRYQSPPAGIPGACRVWRPRHTR
jgi:hypothetical protein